MFDFRLKVFYTAAKRLNFTMAADELFITQPAVTKHIHEIENYFRVKVFERNGSKIKLTPQGQTLLQYTEQLITIYNNLDFEMNSLSKRHNGTLRIGASTTIAQYVLPPVLASFHKKFNDIKIILSFNNTNQIEVSLQNNEIDLGIIEGYSKKPDIKYSPFLKDEIVLVAGSKNSLTKKQNLKIQELKNIPLLLREPGSGTLEVIAHALKPLGIKISDLKNEMQLASSESIKLYLLNSDCVAFLSIYSILNELKNNDLNIIEVKGLQIERLFYFIQKHGQPDALPELFMKFAGHYNFK